MQPTEQTKEMTGAQKAAAGTVALGVIGALVAGGIFAQKAEKAAHEALLKELTTAPLSGQIALANGNRIEVIEAATAHLPTRSIRTFQVQGSPRNLLWATGTQLVFSTDSQTRPAELESVREKAEKSNEMPHGMDLSDQIWVLDTDSGTLTSVFNSYALTESGKAIFGDPVHLDIAKHQQTVEFFNPNDEKKREKEEAGLKIKVGSSAACDISDLALDPGSHTLYMLVENDWISFDLKGSVSRPVQLPRGLVSEQRNDPARPQIAITSGWLSSPGITNGSATFAIGSSGSEVAWYVPEGE
jgi:ABC-type uncharacterized transport system permease subunit